MIGQRTATNTDQGRVAVSGRNLSKLYGMGATTVTALDDVTIDIPAGRFTAIMGASGSGKSTLMHCLAALDTPTSGEIWMGDTELGRLSETDRTLLRGRRVGFVFQSFNLLPAFTAEQNMLLPLELAGRPVDRDWMRLVVSTLGLDDRLHHRPAELSGGQQQRVAIARALVMQPDVIYADEPTGNLDSASSEAVLALLERCVRDFGQTVVMVTHDAAAAARSDEVVVLADGRIQRTMTQPGVAELLSLAGGGARRV